MNRSRLCCFITGIVLLVGITGCDSQNPEPFSVTVQVENQDGDPIEGAKVGVRPYYGTGRAHATFRQSDVQAKAVELSSFSASVDERDVVLEWKTEEEAKNAGFRIELKDDASFERVDFVEGAGTTSQPQSYQYRDKGLSLGEYSYRLVAVDTDGNESPTDPLSVRVVGAEAARIQAPFPNPFFSETTLVLAAAAPSEMLSTVHLLNGEKVDTIVDQKVQVSRRMYAWPVENYPAGLYQIRTQVQRDNQTVARDTAYVVYSSIPSNAAPIGTTSANGTVSTSERTWFPALFDIPPIDLRNDDGNDVGTLSSVPETIQFVVTTQENRYTFERRVAEGSNDITLTVDM